MAISLIGIFLPIYIYNISFDYSFFHINPVINGFYWVLSYFLIRSITVWVGILIFGKLLFSKLHLQMSILISFVVLIILILSWHAAESNLFIIWFSAILHGLDTTFYWIPFHIFFMKKAGGNSTHFGQKTGMRFFLTRLFSSIAPAVGGLIIMNFGFNMLFLSSILLLIVAALPITLVVHEWRHREHNPIRVLKDYLLDARKYKLTLTYFGEGVEAVIYAVFWPLLLFFVLENFVKIGFINSVSFLLSSFSVLLIGKALDKHGTKKIHKIGTILNALFYLPRIFFSKAWLFYSLDVLDRFISGTYSLPIMSLSYEKGKKLGGSDYMLFREYALHLGIIVTVLVIMAVFMVTDSWRWVFFLAMIGSSLGYLIELDKN
ncbi:hypothetical protein ACFL0C_01425 [Patescibacteria group bacterium]